MKKGRRFDLLYMALLVSVGAFLYFISRKNYLLFHTLSEGYSILVTGFIYLLAIKTYKYSKNNYFLFIGISYLFIGIIDFLHLASFKGMRIFPDFGADQATQLWIFARYMEAFSLLTATLFIKRSLSYLKTMLIYGLLTCAGLLSILYVEVFPACFIDGEGLTPFKIISEYIICGIILIGIWRLYKRKDMVDKFLYKNMIPSMAVTIASELSFTLYTDVYGFMNFLGHILKIISFLFIYYGIVKVGLENPYEFIFKELKRSSVTDYLTGAHNRTGFYEYVEKLKKDFRHKNKVISILLVDIDNFKEINDKYGHLFGDDILKKIGQLIKSAIRKDDFLCRFGGDEFIIITSGGDEFINKIKERILEKVRSWVRGDERLKDLDVSAGIAVGILNQDFDINRLIEIADKNMYKEKWNK